MYGELEPIDTADGERKIPALHLPTAVIDEKTRQRLRANSRRCYEKHKARIPEAKRRYKLEHPEVVAEYDRRADARYRERLKSDPEYRARELAKDRAYASKRLLDPEQHAKILANAARRRLAPRNREQMSVRFAARQARKFRAESLLTLEEWRELLARYGNRCLCCGSHFESLEPDHVVPLSRGGSNWISNIQPLCRPCNKKKHALTIDYRLEGHQCTAS